MIHPWKHMNLLGQTFGKLRVLNPAGSDGKKTLWLVRCACGNERTIRGVDLRKGQKFCGHSCPFAKESIGNTNRTHGMSHHPAYAVWSSMVDRCTLPTHKAWKNYGGRGIKVCPEWKKSFTAFWADMGPTYRKGVELDRRDNDKGYNAQNCRWVSRSTNARNRRGSFASRTGAPENWSELLAQAGVKKNCAYHRAKSGWTWDNIIGTPVDVANGSRRRFHGFHPEKPRISLPPSQGGITP